LGGTPYQEWLPFIGASGLFFAARSLLDALASVGRVPRSVPKGEGAPSDGAFSELIGLSVCEL